MMRLNVPTRSALLRMIRIYVYVALAYFASHVALYAATRAHGCSDELTCIAAAAAKKFNERQARPEWRNLGPEITCIHYFASHADDYLSEAGLRLYTKRLAEKLAKQSSAQTAEAVGDYVQAQRYLKKELGVEFSVQDEQGCRTRALKSLDE